MIGAKDDARVGTMLAERYRIDALIGEGGMGRVYAAEHVLMKKRLAVKVLRRELTTVPEVVARFEREAMAAACVDHPNVAAATDFGKLPDGSVYLVLEYVQGRSLRDEIAEGPLELERSLHIARQIAAGLGAAHFQRIVHRDLKPENVMLVERGGDRDVVKVLDFGIAKVSLTDAAPNGEQPITRAGMVFGTPEYMAPEQALGQAVDGRADLYSLGVILFEMLSGVRPFSSLSAVGILGQQLGGPAPTLVSKAPSLRVPPAIEQIVARLLEREREARFADAGELVACIDALLEPTPGRGALRYTLAEGTSRISLEPDELESHSRTPRPSVAHQPPAPAKRAAFESEPAPPSHEPAAGLFASVIPPAEVLREKLPERLRESLRPVRTRTLLIVTSMFGVVVAVLLIVVAVAIVRRSAAPAAAASARTASVREAVPSAAAPAAIPSSLNPPPPLTAASATPGEWDAALKQGPAATEALLRRYPLDAHLLLDAGEAELGHDPLKATNRVARALALDAKVAEDERAARVLTQAAEQRASSETAFALLEGPMGARGADAIWDLAADEKVPLPTRARAGRWLRSPDFRRAASPSLLLAADLRTASSCEAAHELLQSGTALVDARSLPQLEAWTKTQGCGAQKRQDCMPCLRNDAALEQALAAARSR